MIKGLILSISSTLVLIGCASLPPYVPPAAGEASAIVDVSRMHADSICTKGVFYSVTKPKDGKLLVPASGRVALYSYIQIAGYNVNYTCLPGISFQPESGQSYLLNLEIMDQKCRLEIYREGAKNRVGLDVVPSAGPGNYCN